MEIKVEHIYKSYEDITVLKDISFSLEKGQKIGLVGNNGIGKSTLLEILAGIVDPDEGSMTTRKGLVVSYIPQDTSLVTNETVHDYLRQVSGIKALEDQLAISSEATTKYKNKNGYSFNHRMESILAGFGLSEIRSDQLISAFSSGQKSKVFMAGVLLSNPDLLLLDEPTNNLDIPALIWLEDFLKQSKVTSVIVSHDRLFLDGIVDKIFAINWQTRVLRITNGKYSDYLKQLKKEQEQQSKEYEAQQEEIKRLTKTARAKRIEAGRGSRFRGSDNDKFLRGFKRDRAAKSGDTAKTIEKRIEQMELVEKPIGRDAFRIYIRPLKQEGSGDIVLEKVMAGYSDSDFRIGPVSITIPYGSRLMILGLNGAGKSTLLKTIGGELKPLTGKVKIGNALTVGNLMQEHDNLPRQETLKDFLINRADITAQAVYALVAKFGFKAAEVDKKIGNLSPGARSRLLLALFSALSVNVLLLDEPTNHLDIEAFDALEEAVAHYEGTILLVSHDRHFLQNFRSTDTYILSNGKLIRQQSFELYLTEAKLKAKRLIKMFN